MGTIITILLVLVVIVIIGCLVFPGKSPEQKRSLFEQSAKEKVMECQLAGVSHYKGKVKPGHIVELFHDPYNEYDKNAIEVRTLSGKMIGFIPKRVNKKLLNKWGGKKELFGKVQAVYYRHTEVHIQVYSIG